VSVGWPGEAGPFFPQEVIDIDPDMIRIAMNKRGVFFMFSPVCIPGIFCIALKAY
jgi:hypothetical protein